jgi:hypothetical protein
MTLSLTSEEIGLLAELAEAGERGRIISAPTPRIGMKRLVEAGYVTERAISLDAVLYVMRKPIAIE